MSNHSIERIKFLEASVLALGRVGWKQTWNLLRALVLALGELLNLFLPTSSCACALFNLVSFPKEQACSCVTAEGRHEAALPSLLPLSWQRNA